MEDTDGQPSSLNRRQWQWVIAAAVVSTLVRCLFATRRGFWLDELYTFYAASLPIAKLIPERIAVGHSPLPFLYAKIFYTTFGDSELGLKLSSILAGFFATIAVGGLAGSLGLQRILPVLLALLIVDPYWHSIATEFRYMMPLVAAASFWLWGAVGYLRSPTAKGFWFTTAFGAITLWLHSSAIFILAGIIVMYLWHAIAEGIYRRGPFAVLRLFAPLLVALLLMMPLTIALAHTVHEQGRPHAPDPFKAINKLAESFFADPGTGEEWTGLKSGFVQVPSIILFCACAIAAVVRLRRERNTFAVRAIFGVIAGMCIAAMIYTAAKNNVQGPVRYAAFASVPVALILGIGLMESARWKAAGLLLQGPFAAIALYCFALQLIEQGDWHRESVQWLAKNRQPHQPVIAIGRAMNLFAFEYYGVEETGWIDGLSDDTRAKAVFKKTFRTALTHGEPVLLFHYRGFERKDEVEESIASLQKSGEIVGVRVWQPSSAVRITGFAKTAEGVAELNALPEIPGPRFSSSSQF